MDPDAGIAVKVHVVKVEVVLPFCKAGKVGASEGHHNDTSPMVVQHEGLEALIVLVVGVLKERL